MRRAAIVMTVAAAALAACEADVAPGTFFCGPERSCPEGQACNGPDNICVLESEVLPFECDPDDDPPGDNTPDTARPIANLSCVSTLVLVDGCMGPGDDADWFRVSVPSTCASVQIELGLTYPVAFQPLRFEMTTGGAAPMVVETPCNTTSAPDDGESERCFVQTVTPGADYAFGITREPGSNCGNTCSFNRYRMSVQLSTP